MPLLLFLRSDETFTPALKGLTGNQLKPSPAIENFFIFFSKGLIFLKKIRLLRLFKDGKRTVGLQLHASGCGLFGPGGGDTAVGV